jgi:hypothetical protein
LIKREQGLSRTQRGPLSGVNSALFAQPPPQFGIVQQPAHLGGELRNVLLGDQRALFRRQSELPASSSARRIGPARRKIVWFLFCNSKFTFNQ